MNDGFIKVAAGSPDLRVADTVFNCEKIKILIDEADRRHINLLVLPELCVTGYTCGDLFYSERLISDAKTKLAELAEYTKTKYTTVVLGVPLKYGFNLYNCAAVLSNGKIIGVVPKKFLPNYGEFYEMRQFSGGNDIPANAVISCCGCEIPFGTDLIFRHITLSDYSFGIEICEDLWAANQPAEALCRSGAVIIANPSASNEVIGKADYRRTLVNSTSARLICGYVYTGSGEQESTTDTVYSAHRIISENGTMLCESKPFSEEKLTVTEIDVKKLAGERGKNTSFTVLNSGYRNIYFEQTIYETELTRNFEKTPFVPGKTIAVRERSEMILEIQSRGLKKRLEHTGAKPIIGISGGLDSTLALIVCVKAMQLLKRSPSEISAVTMPCFGTTSRTKSNAVKLCECLGVTLREINITAAVQQHFNDIGHPFDEYDTAFENAQARERTQVLMDIANAENGIVIGTGDLSESALGFATYSGDHISMYAVNCSVPKTLVRYIIANAAESSDASLKAVLEDILNTPVSPELLPDNNGEIQQKTEKIVGPYELHDFFLYHTVRFGENPKKVFRLAMLSFSGCYEKAEILKWLTVFIKRFFAQQFKRSCMPDGPKIGSVTLSPRTDWRMPSDASVKIWLDELNSIKL